MLFVILIYQSVMKATKQGAKRCDSVSAVQQQCGSGVAVVMKKIGNIKNMNASHSSIKNIKNMNAILNRLKPQAERIIAEEQAGFRAGRSTTGQIFNLRIPSIN